MRIDLQGNCWLGERQLHPAAKAGEAALKEMRGLLERAGGGDTLIIMGAGLGWHIWAALSRLRAGQIIIYQVRPDEKNWCLCLGPELPEQLKWVDNPQQLAAALGERLVYGNEANGKLAVYAAPAYAAAEPELLAQVRELAGRALNRAGKDRQTRQTHAAAWNKHLLDNLEALFSLPDIFNSARAFVNVPALVAGAGPSLDQSLPWLQNMRQKALVLGAASVLGPMAAQGLRPHLVAALESKDESRQFVGVDYSQTCLLAALHSHPHHFTGWPGVKSFFHANSWLPQILNWGGMLPTGGHATSAAFALACLWGCNPIILVGQDLAYTGGKAHASARPGGEEEQARRGLSVPALGGGKVYTSTVMQSYLEWYEEAAAYLRQRQPQIKVINCTAAGAEIAGFAWQSLEETLASLPLREDLGQSLPALLENTARLSRQTAAPGVRQAARLLARSFTSPQDLSAALQDSILSGWLAEALAGGWRKALAHLRLLLDTLQARL